MPTTAVDTPDAPAAIGPYSQGVAANGFVFVSGQLPIDPETGTFVPGAAAEQTQRCIDNVEHILRAAGSALGAVVKTTVLLADMADFTTVNEVYATRFTNKPMPARAAYQVAELPKGALVEIEAVAVMAD